jgi:hypothetical protein
LPGRSERKGAWGAVGAPHVGESRGRRLVEALAAAASRYAPADQERKRALLTELEGCAVRHAGILLRLHETLCFLQAYPDDAKILELVDRALETFAARVEELGRAARRRLHDSGVTNTTLDYPFGFPMARWLAARFARQTDVAWSAFTEEDRLDETLSLLATTAEGDAFSEGGMGWRQWIQVAKGGRRLSDLQLLLEVFARTRLPEQTRDWLFESLSLPILWRPLGAGGSRTLARTSSDHTFFHPGGLERGNVDLVEALRRPLPLVRAPRRLAEAMIDVARAAMATRQRELHAFSYPNADDVLIGDAGRGLRLVFIGIQPDFRLPLEGYYGFLALKNGVPVSYGGGWELFGTLDFAVNVFASFRQGESAYLATQLLRAYRWIFGMRTVVIDRYQLGHESTEALRSGSFYFYHRLGFRPRDPVVARTLAQERAKIAADPAYRSPVPVLKRLAAAEVFLTLPGGHPAPERRLRATDVSALVARHVAREFGGDRARASRDSAERVARALGAPRRTTWRPAERRAFERMSLVAALIPNLAAWSSTDRRALLAVMRAKGSGSEMDYARRLDGHRGVRRILEDLAQASPQPYQ